MKRQQNPSFALVLKSITLGVLVGGMLVGCSKKNTANPASSNTNTIGPGTLSPGTIGYGTAFSPQVEQLKSQYPCSQGQRLSGDLAYSISTAGSNYSSTIKISGNFQQGALSGQPTSIYVGKSYYNDIIVVTKITNGGNQIIGWNVTLSMCSWNTPSGFPIISELRGLTNFQAPQGINIIENTTSACGGVVANSTYLLAPPYQGLPQTDVITTFAPVSCGSNGYYY